ncbi:TPA: hypothetical protein ACH3X1_002910 [Trebouxia sp. C0004]
MGGRLAALAVGPQTLPQGTQPHKSVFAAADMRRQGFQQQLTTGGASNAHIVSVLFASSRDKALRCSPLVHTVPHTFLSRHNMDGSGSRAGSCGTSLCCDPEHFATVDCSAARCSDSLQHDYVCSSSAVVACLQKVFNNVAWDNAPGVAVMPVGAEENNNRDKRMLQVKTLVGP